MEIMYSALQRLSGCNVVNPCSYLFSLSSNFFIFIQIKEKVQESSLKKILGNLGDFQRDVLRNKPCLITIPLTITMVTKYHISLLLCF